jgi:hypothetical protein
MSRRSRLLVAVLVVGALVMPAGCAGSTPQSFPITTPIPAKCPAQPATADPEAPPLSAARARYVPFTPRSVMLCFYAIPPQGPAPAGVSLAKQVLITDGAVARRLADDLDRAARSSENLNHGIVNCGAALAQTLDAYVQGDGRSIQVRIFGFPGCVVATNGPKRSMIGNSNILEEIQGLLGYDSWPGLP